MALTQVIDKLTSAQACESAPPPEEIAPQDGALTRKLQFIVPVERLIASEALGRGTVSDIEQRYFSPAYIPQLLTYAKHLVPELDRSTSHRWTSSLNVAYLCRAHRAGSHHDTLEFEGATHHAAIRRLSLPLSEHAMQELLPHATEGTVRMTRITTQETLSANTAGCAPTEVHIDLLRDLPPSTRHWAVHFALITFATTHPRVAAAITRGVHPFRSLQGHCARLWEQPPHVQKLFELQRIARDGASEALYAAAAAILATH